jgi:hypothetical protein
MSKDNLFKSKFFYLVLICFDFFPTSLFSTCDELGGEEMKRFINELLIIWF